MERFKRNQVEAAILQTLDARDARASTLKLRMKRLLVTDRRLRHNKRSDNRADRGYAFYSQRPPGSGVEVLFSGYEAFALLVALSLLEYGMPQATVVRIMRQLRPDLEAAHSDSLKKDPKVLFDPLAVQAMASPGMLAVDNTDPVFLAMVNIPDQSADKGKVRTLLAVCPGHQAVAEFRKDHVPRGTMLTAADLVSMMHTLAKNLSQTHPIRRGRSTV